VGNLLISISVFGITEYGFLYLFLPNLSAMSLTKTVARPRIHSIDILRGVVMVIMALDHTRDFFHKIIVEGGASVATGPTDLDTTTPLLFFTRWITHFCAPIFVFLAGTSAYLMSLKKSKAELSRFLITRGFWLILVEIIIITFGWTFNPLFNVIILQVIWAIGVSMVLLGLLVNLPYKVLLAIGIIIVFGHNLLDNPSISSGLKGSIFADLVYFGQFSVVNLDGTHFVFIVYSFLAWTGVMILGYCFGRLFTAQVDAGKRIRILLQLGFGLLLLFVILRSFNLYGDPVPWAQHPRGAVFSFLSFINLNKYPPSLQFLSVTIGVGMIALALLETARGKLAGIFRIYGRVPMFYYILHFYILHLIVVIVFFAQGFPTSEIVTPNNPFLFRPAAFGFGLAGVYIVWLITVILLFPLCRWYDRYKSAHIGEKKWLAYL
jgi:uncharacterized membrane protein